MDPQATSPPKLPPAWFKHAFWKVHRALYKVLGRRVLWTPASKRGWGAARLTTIGRTSGKERTVIVGYLDDGRDLVVLAMNGWDPGHPAWWRNLEAHPDAVVETRDQPARPVRALVAEGAERDRLWARWAAVDEGLDGYAAMHAVETPVVRLVPVTT